MIKRIFIILFLCICSLQNFSQTNNCNLSVTIDSLVVAPCFKISAGGSCGCSNVLWAVVSGGTAPYTYTWSTNGIAEGHTDTLNGACYVLWNVIVKDANGCIDTSSINIILPAQNTDTTAGILKYDKNIAFDYYPQPVKDNLIITFDKPINNDINIQIYNVGGKSILTQSLSKGAKIYNINSSSLNSGVYFFIIDNSIRIKIIKQ